MDPARTFQKALNEGDRHAVDDLLADLDDPNPVGRPPFHPPLHWACYRGDRTTVDRLLDAGARPDHHAFGRHAPDCSYLPVHAAIYACRSGLVEHLVERGSPVDLAVCVSRGDEATARRLVSEDPRALRRPVWHIRYSVLHLAADVEAVGMIPLLVELGLDPDVEDGDGHAPMRYAARNAPALPTLEALVRAGADVDHASRTGLTALTSACRHRESLPTVRWLLEHGADPNRATKDGTTPLHKACANRVTPMVRLLLEHGADPARRGKRGETPLDVARRRKATAIVELLEAVGKDTT